MKIFETLEEREKFEDEVWEEVTAVMENPAVPYEEKMLIVFTLQTCTNILDAIIETYKCREQNKELNTRVFPALGESADDFMRMMRNINELKERRQS